MATSILDNDLYKFSMQQAVLQLYPEASVEYEFKNRNPSQFQFSNETIALVREKIFSLSKLQLEASEKEWLSTLGFFKPEYIDYLATFRYQPEKHVEIRHVDGSNLAIKIKGNWAETILYEVPILALVSEAYFESQDKDWDMKQQYEAAFNKCSKLADAGIQFRRRRNFETQEIVVRAMSECARNHRNGNHSFVGTSNVYFAKKFNLVPIGTVAHEWTMAISALVGNGTDLLHANKNALQEWLKVYPDSFLTALCDTYGTPAFLNDFSKELAARYTGWFYYNLGVRQDSGNPKHFVDLVVEKYKQLGVDLAQKSIIFSDSLNVEKCINLDAYVKTHGGGISAKFGVGTHFTNDFKKLDGTKSKAMEIVIKIAKVNGIDVVKLSDDVGKNQGASDAVQNALKVFGRE